MSIFRDQTLTAATAIFAGLVLLCALGVALGGTSPHPALARDGVADQQVQVWRGQLGRLVQLGVARDPQVQTLAAALTTDAEANAEANGDSPLGRAWQQAADHAGALAGPTLLADTVRLGSAVDAVLAAGDALALTALDGVFRPVSDLGTSLQPGVPTLRRDTPRLPDQLAPAVPARPVLVPPTPDEPRLDDGAPSAPAPQLDVPQPPALAP